MNNNDEQYYPPGHPLHRPVNLSVQQALEWAKATNMLVSSLMGKRQVTLTMVQGELRMEYSEGWGKPSKVAKGIENIITVVLGRNQDQCSEQAPAQAAVNQQQPAVEQEQEMSNNSLDFVFRDWSKSHGLRYNEAQEFKKSCLNLLSATHDKDLFMLSSFDQRQVIREYCFIADEMGVSNTKGFIDSMIAAIQAFDIELTNSRERSEFIRTSLQSFRTRNKKRKLVNVVAGSVLALAVVAFAFRDQIIRLF